MMSIKLLCDDRCKDSLLFLTLCTSSESWVEWFNTSCRSVVCLQINPVWWQMIMSLPLTTNMFDVFFIRGWKTNAMTHGQKEASVYTEHVFMVTAFDCVYFILKFSRYTLHNTFPRKKMFVSEIQERKFGKKHSQKCFQSVLKVFFPSVWETRTNVDGNYWVKILLKKSLKVQDNAEALCACMEHAHWEQSALQLLRLPPTGC